MKFNDFAQSMSMSIPQKPEGGEEEEDKEILCQPFMAVYYGPSLVSPLLPSLVPKELLLLYLDTSQAMQHKCPGRRFQSCITSGGRVTDKLLGCDEIGKYCECADKDKADSNECRTAAVEAVECYFLGVMDCEGSCTEH